MLALLAPPAGSAAPGHPAGASPCGGGFDLTESATDGPAPLLVSFELSGPYDNSSAISWSFGDGSFLNGTGAEYSFAAESYARPGSFHATVTVGDPSAPIATCSATVTVQPGPLVVGFIASVYSGPAPLTVQFTGSISGGTGVYRSELWSFGDGNNSTGITASYTFPSAGDFRVVWTVADSSGAQGESSREIDVLPAPARTPGPPRGGSIMDLTGWIVLSVGVAGAVVAVGYYRLTRRRAVESTHDEIGPRPPAGATLPAPDPASVGTSAPAPGASPERSPGAPMPGAPPPHRPDRSPPAVGTVLQTSQRIIVHLARQGQPPVAPIGARGLTQVGISEALGVEQSNLARALQRLEIAGMVSRDLRHVPGVSRRVRIYLLTPNGQRVAAALLHTGGGSGGPAAVSETTPARPDAIGRPSRP